jgi:diguanylate cyclase (GGDEF)-like protein/PAS domain S-box-containing protein
MPAHLTSPVPHGSPGTTKPETLWRAVFEQSHLGIVMIDPATDRIIDLNQRFADLAGRSRDALRGQDWMHLTHADDLAHEVKHKAQLRQGLIPCFLRDKRYVHPDGTVVWVHVNETRVTVTEGEPPCFLAMVEDVTEQRRTRLALNAEREAAARLEQEQRLEAVADQGMVGLLETDLDGRITFVNDRYCAITGRTRESVIGQRLREITHADNRPHLTNTIGQLLAQGRSFMHESRYVLPDGRKVWLLCAVSLQKDTAGNPAGTTTLVLDMTERKRQERAQRQTLELLHMAERAAEAGAWDWDMRTARLNWSPALFQLFGLDPEQTQATFDTWRARVHPDDLAVAERALEEAVRHRRPFVASYRIVRPSGEVRWIDAHGQHRYDADGAAVHFTGLCIDATLRHQTESQIRQLNAELESKVEARTAELAQANAALHRLARHDVLTGLPNRLAANERLREELVRMRRSHLPYAVLMLDVDHFKRVNDLHGHAVGDRVLQRVSQGLRAPLRESDFVARFGGEEFLVLLPHTDEAGACLVAEKLRQVIEAAPDPTAGLVSISVGVAMASAADDDEDTAVMAADARLYSAKHSGRNRVVHQDPANG